MIGKVAMMPLIATQMGGDDMPFKDQHAMICWNLDQAGFDSVASACACGQDIASENQMPATCDAAGASIPADKMWSVALGCGNAEYWPGWSRYNTSKDQLDLACAMMTGTLLQTADPAPAPAPATDPAPAATTDPATPAADAPAASGSKTPIIIGVVAAVVVIGGIFWWRSKKNEQEGGEDEYTSLI